MKSCAGHRTCNIGHEAADCDAQDNDLSHVAPGQQETSTHKEKSVDFRAEYDLTRTRGKCQAVNASAVIWSLLIGYRRRRGPG
jgi:hypothetical protein